MKEQSWSVAVNEFWADGGFNGDKTNGAMVMSTCNGGCAFQRQVRYQASLGAFGTLLVLSFNVGAGCRLW